MALSLPVVVSGPAPTPWDAASGSHGGFRVPPWSLSSVLVSTGFYSTTPPGEPLRRTSEARSLRSSRGFWSPKPVEVFSPTS